MILCFAKRHIAIPSLFLDESPAIGHVDTYISVYITMYRYTIRRIIPPLYIPRSFLFWREVLKEFVAIRIYNEIKESKLLVIPLL